MKTPYMRHMVVHVHASIVLQNGAYSPIHVFVCVCELQVKVTNCGGSLDGPVVKHGFKKPNATLGPLRVARAEPGHFMKKGAGNPRLEKRAIYSGGSRVWHDCTVHPSREGVTFYWGVEMP